MTKHKYSLTNQQFAALRKLLKTRQTTPFLDENIEAAHEIMVKNQRVRVVADRIGKSVGNLSRIVRHLWCIANGMSHWDLYLHNKWTKLANETVSIAPKPKRARKPGSDAKLLAIRSSQAARDTGRRKSRKDNTSMRCVYRSFELRGSGYGWQVAILRKSGETTHHFVNFFADVEHGDEKLSLAAAKAWRDDIERNHARSTHAHKGTQAPTGVYRTVYPMKTRDGKIAFYGRWQARSPHPTIRTRRQLSFSVSRYGEEEAFRLAVEARKRLERMLL